VESNKPSGETENPEEPTSFQKTKEQMIFYLSLGISLITLTQPAGYNLSTHDPETQPWWNRITQHIVLGALPFHESGHVDKLKLRESMLSSLQS
jgi:hypothetical protein